MTVTEALAALHDHFRHRFHLDLEVLVDKSGAVSSVEWAAFDPVHGVRETSPSLAGVVALVLAERDSTADLDAAVADLPTP